MKKILILALLLIQLFSYGQNQISELQKSAVFHWAGSEWHPNQDLVSGTVGTATDTYNVLDRQGNGRRYLENVNTSYSSLADDARYDFGTGDFTLIASFTPANITDNGKYIISKEAGGVGYGLYQEDNDIWLRFDDNTTDVSAIIGTDILVAGTKITCEVVFNRAGNAVLYLNNSASSSGTVAISTANLTLDNTGAFVVGNIESHNQGFTGQIHFVRAFNFALTTQITNYPRPEYPIEAAHRGAGANKNVLDLNAEGLSQSTSGYWYDKTNSLTATNSGTSLVVPPASNLGGTWFNGTTSNIAFTGMNGLTGDITISYWVVHNKLPAVAAHFLVNGKLYVELGNDYKLRIYRNGTNNATSNVLSLNTVYNIVITSTSTGYTQIYTNNILHTQDTNAGTPVSATLNLFIGAAATYYPEARISNVNIWNRILDQDQITLLYSLGH